MNRRECLGVSALAAVAVAAPAVAAQSKTECPIDEAVMQAAGTLWLMAYTAHGPDGLRRAFAALAQVASPGCG